MIHPATKELVLKKLLPFNFDFAAARLLVDQAIAAAVNREERRCVRIIDECIDADDIQNAGDAIIWIREGIEQESDPTTYRAPELRPLVQRMRNQNEATA